MWYNKRDKQRLWCEKKNWEDAIENKEIKNECMKDKNPTAMREREKAGEKCLKDNNWKRRDRKEREIVG